MVTTLLLWSAAAFAGLPGRPFQDLNCDGIPNPVANVLDPAVPLDAGWTGPVEVPVDSLDPVCAAVLAATPPGRPLPDTTDWYLDYEVDGCAWPIGELDGDGDGLGGGVLEVFAPGGVVLLRRIVLTCDDCPSDADPLQADGDGDGMGDACDVCPDVPRPAHEDADGDGLGDDCDNCVDLPNEDQADLDQDGRGDACDACPSDPRERGSEDADGDGVGDGCDLCPSVADPGQGDADADGVGDACDGCPFVADSGQGDADEDGVGDACDNCPAIPNGAQGDRDLDGVGDLCDPTPDGGAAPGPGETGLVDTDTDAAPDPTELPGCGCDAAPAAPFASLALFALVAVRRRR